MTKTITVGLIQDGVADTAAQTAVDTAARIREAAKKGAQVICLKELFNAPYFCKSLKQEYFNFAEPIPGATSIAFAALAKELGVVLVIPIYEREAAGLYHNSAVVIDADGSQLGIYRKMHIPHDPLFEEKYYFAPGDAVTEGTNTSNGFKVWKTRYGTIGVLICWDQWYPEAARITALLGADILLYPTAIGWHPAEKKEWGATQVDSWRTAQRAHAIANGVFVAAVNRVGFEPEPGTDGLEFFGHSFIADPYGRVIADAGEKPEVLIAKCDLSLVESARRNWPFLRDRRIDAYGPILKRWIG
jgi:N-carbamoylputrescine amidase